MSGKVSVVSDHVAIEGRFLDFYIGEWANDSVPVRRALSFIRINTNLHQAFLGRPRDQSETSQKASTTSL